MKKLLAIVLALALCLGMVTMATAETTKYKIGVLVPAVTHGWVGGITYNAEQYCKELEAAGNALDILGSGEPEVLPLTLPGGEERSLVICQKLRFTPKGYPRHGGTILKHPL